MNNSYLRFIKESDLPIVLAWRNSEHVRKHMYNDAKISMEDHIQWFHKMEQDDKHFVFIYIQNNVPLGLVQLTNIERRFDRLYWGFYIGDKKAPRGSGTEMGILELNKIFTDFSINKVCAEVVETNQQSMAFHEKLGFKQEGLFQQHIKKNGKYVNVIPYALFKEEWRGVVK